MFPIVRRLPLNLPKSIALLHSSALNLTAITPTSSQTLDLDDTHRLFSSIPTSSLISSLSHLYAMAFSPLVDLGIAAFRSRVISGTEIGRRAIKATAYARFCAGEDAESAARTLTELWDRGMRGILDYGLEDAEDNAACDRNLAGFLHTVEMTSSLPRDSVSFACVKVTAICPITLLERVSDLLRWEQKKKTTDLPWKSHSIPILSPSSPLYHTPSSPPPLSETEEQDLRLAEERLVTLCLRCSDFNVPLLIDAEYTSVQPAIDYLTYSAMLRFNHNDQPIVYGTIQAYLRDAKERLMLAVEAAENERISIGFKLVRGAYLTRETKLASSLGAASPIHRSIEETHACYNDCTFFMLGKIISGSGSVVLATHNFDSGKFAAAKAEELGIDRGDQKLQFAQLKGMAEALSIGLSNAGFQVSKYLPFGPVDQVIPYLLRRAEENRGFLSASTVDRQLMRKEIKRRLKAMVLGRE
ncbi:putative proline dehydrogenase [Dioscorea sansibarensis]